MYKYIKMFSLMSVLTLLLSVQAFAGRYSVDLSISHEEAKEGETIQVMLSNMDIPENGFIRVYMSAEHWDGGLKTTGGIWVRPDENVFMNHYWNQDGVGTVTPNVTDRLTSNGTFITFKVTAQLVIISDKPNKPNRFIFLDEDYVTIFK